MRKVKLFSVVVTVLAIVFAMSAVTMAETNFGGKTVTFVNFGGDPPGHFTEGGILEGRVEEAEEKFNAVIEFEDYAFSDWEEAFMTRLLAGDSTYDVWYIQQRQFWKLMPQGAFYPVSEVLSDAYYDNLPAFSSAVNRTLNLNGKIYGFGYKYGDVHPLKIVAYNQSLFERLGLKDLQELYEEGNWTWAKMEELAIEATQDTDGDGEIDQWGLGEWNMSLGLYLALANDAPVSKYDETGKRVFSFDSEEAVRAMEFVHKLTEVDKVVGGGWQQFVDGQVAMAPMGQYLLGNQVNPNMEDEYGVVPYPLGPDAEDHRYPAEALVVQVLPANVEMPAELIDLYHYLWPRDVYDEATNELLESYVRDRKSYEILQTAIKDYSGTVFDLEFVLGPIWDFEQPFTTALSDALSGEKSPSAAMEEIKATAQSTIDELFMQ